MPQQPRHSLVTRELLSWPHGSLRGGCVRVRGEGGADAEEARGSVRQHSTRLQGQGGLGPGDGMCARVRVRGHGCGYGCGRERGDGNGSENVSVSVSASAGGQEVV